MNSSTYPSASPDGSGYGSHRTVHSQGPGLSDLSRRGLVNVPSSMKDPHLPPPSFGSSQDPYSNAAPHLRSNNSFASAQYQSQQSQHHHEGPGHFQTRKVQPLQTHYNSPSFREEEDENRLTGGGIVRVGTDENDEMLSETSSVSMCDDTPPLSGSAKSETRSPSGHVDSSRQSGIEPKDEGTDAESLGEAFAKYLASPNCASRSDALTKLNKVLKGEGFSIQDREDISSQSGRISVLEGNNKSLSDKNSTLGSNFEMVARGYQKERDENAILKEKIDILNENNRFERMIGNNNSRLSELHPDTSALSFSPQFYGYKQGTHQLTDLDTLLAVIRTSSQRCSPMSDLIAKLRPAHMLGGCHPLTHMAAY